ncbi:hypothetical protein [Cryobacterium glaciale]|uniref:hypothetical protein n=1 Tax=Cryobacterium glaciale TaxID=1259145 RepID=UPI00141AE767|nr:hypothetical protein [Cryobacterium glaciale]
MTAASGRKHRLRDSPKPSPSSSKDFGWRPVFKLDLVPPTAEPELWWEDEDSLARMPCWSKAFALDLIGCVDVGADFPFAVIGEACGQLVDASFRDAGERIPRGARRRRYECVGPRQLKQHAAELLALEDGRSQPGAL